MFPSIKKTGLKSKDMENILLNKIGIAAVSGTSFEKYGEGYIRFSYANSEENIRLALKKIKNYSEQKAGMLKLNKEVVKDLFPNIEKKKFELITNMKPSGDQIEAIKELTDGLIKKEDNQVLLGVTGSGKTFTVANVINIIQKPSLIMAPNKTLAAQLYGEMKLLFPKNAVEYFVSYYDYYQA